MTGISVVLLSTALVSGQAPAVASDLSAAAVAYERTGSSSSTAGDLAAEPAPAAPEPTATATPEAAAGTGGEGGPDAGDPIPGSYIVRFSEDSGPRGEREIKKAADDLTDRVGGRVTAVYTTALKGFSAKLSAGQAREIARLPRVASVHQDVMLKAASAPSGTGPKPPGPPWHLDRLDQANLPLSGTFDAADASGAHIYIFDTGVRATHEEFGGRVKDGPEGTDHGDCEGHGTAVAGVAAAKTFGVAKNATIHRVRVHNCEGYGPATDALKAVDWVTRSGPRPAVVNMSWGTGKGPLEDAIRNSIDAGVTYVAAAPDGPVDACNGVPASVPGVITVGAVDRTDQSITPSYGTCIDLFAPGSEIATAARADDTATTLFNGSSSAAPLVAGAAAVYLSAHPRATPKEVADALIACASTGLVVNPGPGSPNRLLSTDCGGEGRIRLTNPGRQVTVKGDPVKISTVGVTGTRAGAVRYSATGLPGGVSIDAATGVISGTPTEVGVAVVKITATVGAGSTSASFAWEVAHGHGTVALAAADSLCLDNPESWLEDGRKIQLHKACRQTWLVGADGRIVFQGGNNDYCLAVSDKDSADGPLIVLSRCSHASAQVWEPQTDGTLRNPATGRCLSAPRLDLIQLTLAACDGGQGQKWRLPPRPKNPLTVRPPKIIITPRDKAVSVRIPVTSLDTTQGLRHSATGLPAGLSIDPATGIITGSPRVSGSTTVTITVTPTEGSAASASFPWQVADGRTIGINGQCLDVRDGDTKDNTPVQLLSCDEGSRQLWLVRSDGRLQAMGNCLTPRPDGAGDNILIVTSACSDAAAQVWEPRPDGTVLNPASGRCLTSPVTDPAVQLVLAACTGAGTQIWTLPTDPGAGLFGVPHRQDLLVGAEVDFGIGRAGTGSYRASGLPEGLSIDAASGRIHGKPVKVGAGETVITATGVGGATGRGVFSWSVHHGPITGPGKRCTDNRNGEMHDGNPVVLSRCGGGVSQRWTVRTDGTLEVMGKCLTVEGDATAAGSPIVIQECRGLASQVWKLQDDVMLRNPASGRCLSAPDPAGSNQLILADCRGEAAQQWLLPTRVVTGVIAHASGEICLEPVGVSGLTSWDCNRTAPQLFTTRWDGRVQDRDGRCMTAQGGGRTPGTNVVRAECDSADALQVWRQQTDGTLLNSASDLCLNIDLPARRLFTLETCTGATDQRWSIPVLPEP